MRNISFVVRIGNVKMQAVVEVLFVNVKGQAGRTNKVCCLCISMLEFDICI
jgi:hypothetical protein